MQSPLLSTCRLRRIIPYLLLVLSLLFTQNVAADRIIQSTSLNECMDDSMFSATLFNVTFLPDSNLLIVKVNGMSMLSGKVNATLTIVAYGYNALVKELDPCGMKGLEGMCPMDTGTITLNSNIEVSDAIANAVPGIAYQVPDLDGIARIEVFMAKNGKKVACVEAPLSNGKTVDQHGVGWTTAIIAGLGLVASAITSGLGHSNTAAHVAANAVSLFGYFQALSMLGMSAVKLPPIVSAWTQNFDWCMGIIEVGFMQRVLHWYIQATGGEPTHLLNRLSEVSVRIAKRSLDVVDTMPYSMSRAAMYGFEEMSQFQGMGFPDQPVGGIFKRSNNDDSSTSSNEVISVSGIERVAFKAKIETSNFFMTGLAFFVVFLIGIAVCVSAFKGCTEMAIQMKWIRGTKFQDFRNGWLTVLKGIMYRLVLIGFPQMMILCLWELTQKDSGGAVTLAIFFFLSMIGILGWASFKVILIAQRSVNLHKNPAYILYSDPAALNRWGFLYVQFRASSYYYIVPMLLYFLLKAIFIAFGQNAGTVQAFALLVIEFGYLVAVSMMRPWMDKRTNIFNISICGINFLNVIFLVIFTDAVNAPDMVVGVMGVIFFVMNAAFALVLLVLVLVSSVYALVSRNPDVRYQPMRDDRGSFIKTQSQMMQSTELDALGVTARGDMKTRDLDDDGSSFHSTSPPRHREHYDPSRQQQNQFDMPHSPVGTSVPMFPSHSHDGSRGMYQGQQQQQPQQYRTLAQAGRGPTLLTPSGQPVSRSGATPSPTGSQGPYQGQNGPPGQNQWFVGAGYER